MKKIIKLTALVLIVVMITSTILTSCFPWQEQGQTTNPTTSTTKPECTHVDADNNGFCDECGAIVKLQDTEETFSYYANTKLPEDKKIYVSPVREL